MNKTPSDDQNCQYLFILFYTRRLLIKELLTCSTWVFNEEKETVCSALSLIDVWGALNNQNARDEGNLRIAFKKDTCVFDVLSYVS